MLLEPQQQRQLKLTSLRKVGSEVKMTSPHCVVVVLNHGIKFHLPKDNIKEICQDTFKIRFKDKIKKKSWTTSKRHQFQYQLEL